MSKKWVMIDCGVKDTATGMTFDSFWELLTVLNGQSRQIKHLAEENKKLREQSNPLEFNWTQRRTEFNKDSLYIKDMNTEIRLNNGNLCIKVFIPQINDIYYFNYIVTERKLINEFIANSKELKHKSAKRDYTSQKLYGGDVDE